MTTVLTDQDGDVVLCQTPDGGEINVSGGLVEMSGGLETCVYLALFGGNDLDSVADDDRREFWGNLSETETSRKYRSETQFILNTAEAIPFNLARIRAAVLRDLAFLVEVGAASEVSAVVTMPGLNQVKIVVNVDAFGREQEFAFSENWKATI